MTSILAFWQGHTFSAGMQLLVPQCGWVDVPCLFAPKSGSVGTSMPVALCLAASPHVLLPLMQWVKLSLAYLTQAYVDFIPRQSEAGNAFDTGALLG